VTSNRILIKNGTILTLDKSVGNFPLGDVLIEGTKIAKVGPNLAAENAEVIDATDMIVMPGFIDTHRHMWQGALRNSIPNALLADYVRDILNTFRPAMRPEDVRIGDRITALGAINAGVTTLLDWSHIGNSPEHTDAAIDGLRASGVRAVYAFGNGSPNPANQYPQDIRRLRKQHFSSDDQLLTLALAGVEQALGPDVTCIHCTMFTEREWKLVAAAGTHISIARPIEMEMGHGVPPIQQSLDHGIKPSLSVDVETEMTGDLFTQMRAAFTLQRMLALNQPRARTCRSRRCSPRATSSSLRRSSAHAPITWTARSARSHPARTPTSSCSARMRST